MQAQESDLTEVTSDKQKQGVSVMSKTEVSPGVRSVGWASVELFDGVAKGDLRTTPSPQLQDSGPYSYLLFLDPPFLLLKKEISLPIGRKGKTLRLSPCRCLTLFCSPVLSRPSITRFPRLPSEVGGVVMNCPHVQPGPQALLWFDLSTFHIRGSKPPCLLLLVVHSPRMVFQRIMRVDGHLAEESTDTFATCLSLRKSSTLTRDIRSFSWCVVRPPMLRDNGGAPKTFACLEAHAAQPASRAKPNHYSQETHGRDVLEANVPPRKPSVTEPTSSARKDTTPASLPNSTPATTKITAQPPLEQLSKMEKIRLRTGGKEERRKGKVSLEDLLGAVHFHLVAWYLETSLLAGAGVETSERALRERIVWRGEKFPLGFPTLLVSTYLWKRWDSLILRCQGSRRRPQVEATDALIMTPCCQSVLAVMLAGFGQFYLLLDLNQ
ncbi:hypothetical protein Salat_2976000 [Sesamum alatum]|uniref:Uncharacterized protein n=1 Tax=Sesamum alatum TaxID=300844 RepID=A0AAE1XHN6_9LAMI|nr:hypothetical protein Salat_2976000 [Sesamum alatum]